MSVAVLTPAAGIDLASLDEPIVIDRAVASDKEAQGELYRRYQASVRGYVISLMRRHFDEAEEIATEVWISALKSIGTFRNEEPGMFKRWLFGIARRRVVGWRRRAARREQPEAEIDLGMDHGRSGMPETIAIDRVEVQDLLSKLPDRLRLVLLLRFGCDLPEAEVSRVMRAAEAETSWGERTSVGMVGWLTKRALAAVDERVLAREIRCRVRRFLADPTATWEPVAPAIVREAA